MEFNTSGVKSIKKVLSTIGITGRILQEIQKKTKMATGTLVEAIEKLLEYKILKEKTAYFHKNLEIKRGVKFYINDFYLNFFFQIIKPKTSQVKNNYENHLIINEILNWPQKFYYIENFSGGAFENLIEHILQTSNKRSEAIFKKLNLKNINFETNTHWDKEKQFDLIITDTNNKQLRFIECKWTSSTELIKMAIQNLIMKVKLLNLESEPLLSVAIPIHASKTLIGFSKKMNVILITVEDLFG